MDINCIPDYFTKQLLKFVFYAIHDVQCKFIQQLSYDVLSRFHAWYWKLDHVYMKL